MEKFNIDSLTIGQVKAVAALVAGDERGGACKQSVAATAERAVVVCTDKRGVFFGYLVSETTHKGKDGGLAFSVTLKRARNAYYWKCTGGFLELGASGPKAGSKIGDQADIVLYGVTCIVECTEEAVKAWESATWQK